MATELRLESLTELFNPPPVQPRHFTLPKLMEQLAHGEEPHELAKLPWPVASPGQDGPVHPPQSEDFPGSGRPVVSETQLPKALQLVSLPPPDGPLALPRSGVEIAFDL